MEVGNQTESWILCKQWRDKWGPRTLSFNGSYWWCGKVSISEEKKKSNEKDTRCEELRGKMRISLHLVEHKCLRALLIEISYMFLQWLNLPKH